jgi:arylsulfatase A-like enzyme
MSEKNAESEMRAWGGQIRRRDFLALLGAGAAGLFARRLHALEAALGAGKPNIIVIVADDLGYADIGVHGCKDIPTPNIDSLAKNGVRFTNAYVSCPVCSPTRAGLVTGRYQQRFGHEFNPGGTQIAASEIGLPLSEITLANVLKASGYSTGVVGKWHLGMDPKFHPSRRGFDEFFGFLSGSHSYLDPRADPANLILRGTEPVDETEYLTDALTREAVAFITRHRSEPFFLYLTYNAVHAPMHAAQKYLDRFGNIADQKRRTYATMLSAMDGGIGTVLARLRQTGLYDNTMVFFISDNGGPPAANASNNFPLKASKGTAYEGGIRVPFILQWPRRVPRGKTYGHPVISLDIFPTAAAAAGARLPADRIIDGVDLLPCVTGQKKTDPHGILFWRMGERAAVRRGNWKLVRPAAGRTELYDLANDMSETTDLAAQKPDLVQQLARALADWESRLSPPLWQPGGQAAQRARQSSLRQRRLLLASRR